MGDGYITIRLPQLSYIEQLRITRQSQRIRNVIVQAMIGDSDSYTEIFSGEREEVNVSFISVMQSITQIRFDIVDTYRENSHAGMRELELYGFPLIGDTEVC